METSNKKVLIVEDDDDLRKVLASGLSALNYAVIQAADGEAAVSMTVDHKPVLILLDLLLPKLDGFKVLDRIRHYPDPEIAGVKVIVLSNLWSNKDILRTEALKIDEYFVKANADLQEVYAKVKELSSI